MKKQTYEAIIELYVDDKLYKAVSEDEWTDALNELNDILRSKGYHKQWDDLPGFKYPSSDIHVWINWDKKKIVTVCYKARTKLKDSKGNVLYEDDIVYYDGFHKLTVPLSAKPWNEGYYVREYVHHPGGDSWYDTDIDEYNVHMITKVKDVIDFPEKYWNKVKTLDINKL